jgi:hypothetical protein
MFYSCCFLGGSVRFVFYHPHSTDGKTELGEALLERQYIKALRCLVGQKDSLSPWVRDAYF